MTTADNDTTNTNYTNNNTVAARLDLIIKRERRQHRRFLRNLLRLARRDGLID